MGGGGGEAVRTTASVADEYVTRLTTAVSITLGLYEAANIADGVYFMRYLCAFATGIALTFYAERCVHELAPRYGGLFVLPVRIAKRVLGSVQEFLTTMAFQIVIHKVHAGGDTTAAAAASPLRLVSKLLVYAVAFILLTSLPALYSWYLYEDAVLDAHAKAPRSPSGHGAGGGGSNAAACNCAARCCTPAP